MNVNHGPNRRIGVKSLYSNVLLLRLWTISILVLLTTLPSDAGLVQFDFNDNVVGALAGQSGGSEASSWTAGAPHVVQVGDLIAPAGTNFGLAQSAGVAQSVSNDGAPFGTGQLTRPFDTSLTGDPSGSVWFSFLAEVGDGGTRSGIGWDNTSGTTTNPRLLFLGDAIRFINGTGDSGSLGSGFLGQTNLVLGRIDLDTSGSSDELSFWVNPNVNAPLGAPLYTGGVGDAFGSSIDSINLQSYGTNSGAIDFVSFSDTATAFIDVTGAVPLTAAEWTATGSGGWEVGTNWDINQAPDGLDTTFGNAITGPATVTLDADRAVNELVFASSNSYTLAANTLRVGGDVTNSQGSHTIGSNLELAPGTRTLISAAGASLNVTGTTTFTSDGAGTLVLDGAGGGSIGAIRDNNNLANELDGTDNVVVIKRGTGTWTIGSGTGTPEDFHGGNTTVEAGTLAVRANAPGGTVGELRSPVIEVQTGATFDTSDFSTYSLGVGQTLQGGGEVDAGGSGTLQVFSDNVIIPGDSAGTLNVDGNLALNAFEGANPSGSLQFELSASAASGNDQIAVTGNVVSNAGGGGNVTAVSIVPTGTTLQNGGTYELITFGGTHTGSASDYQLDTSLQTRFTQSISIDSDSVNLDIVGSNANVVWRGDEGTNPTFWDVDTTSNWDNGGSDVFFDLDSVTFDDTGVGTTVDVQSDLTPASVTFNNNTKDYTVQGAGSIQGGGEVTKSGTGRVTINNANTYTGTTNITGGVLHAANNAALGDTSGGTTVNGGALDITGANISGEVVTIQGAGSDGRGALFTDGFDSLAGGSQQINHVIQSGPATIAAYSDEPANSTFDDVNDYRWDLEPPTDAPDTDASWQGNGHTLTKKGRGTVSIQRVGDMGGGDINIEQGTLVWQGDATSAGATVTIGDNVNPFVTTESGLAQLNTFYSSGTGPAGSGGVHAINLVLQGGAFANGGSIAQDISITGTVTNNDVTGDSAIDNTISSGSNTLTISSGITGDGDISFGGGTGGTIELQGNNTYTGVTQIGVTLALTGTSQLSGTPQVSITEDGTLDVSGRSDGTLTTSGQAVDLGSATAVVGDLTTSANSVISVFGDGSVTTGTSTVQVTQSQLRRTRHNPNTNQDGTGNQPGGELFIGTISATSGANGNNDIGRGYLSFDLAGETALTGVTDISSVTLTLNRSSLDGTSAAGNQTIELHELVQEWVESEVTPSSASSGVLWTDYTADGDADPCVAANCALGSLVSTELSDPSVFADILFTDNQGGAFEAFIESVLAGSGTANFRVNADAIAEGAAGRAFLKFGGAELEITFDGTIVDAGTALVDGDFTLDATSTLELDIFNATQSDLLDVSGAAALSGMLDTTLLAGSPLAVNDQVTVLTAAGGITDLGISVSGPFTHSVVGNDLVLTFTGAQPGDFDGDGDVDGNDFLTWQRTDGTSAGLTAWQNNYGSGVGTVGAANAAAIPEPTTLVLLAMTGAMGLLRRRQS
ncbi:MAG: autotransporter-associated beta strand repeat-containing protein [Planctomycetota bacterium]